MLNEGQIMRLYSVLDTPLNIVIERAYLVLDNQIEITMRDKETNSLTSMTIKPTPYMYNLIVNGIKLERE